MILLLMPLLQFAVADLATQTAVMLPEVAPFITLSPVHGQVALGPSSPFDGEIACIR
jgi:hypothetical protein